MPHQKILKKELKDAPDEDSIAYRSLQTNTSQKMTTFSDFPFLEETAESQPFAGQRVIIIRAGSGTSDIASFEWSGRLTSYP